MLLHHFMFFFFSLGLSKKKMITFIYCHKDPYTKSFFVFFHISMKNTFKMKYTNKNPVQEYYCFDLVSIYFFYNMILYIYSTRLFLKTVLLNLYGIYNKIVLS